MKWLILLTACVISLADGLAVARPGPDSNYNIAVSGGGGGNNTALDGSAQGATQASGSTCTVTLTTTQTQDLIVVGAEANGPSAISTISDTAGLTWTIGASTSGLYEATAPAPSTLSSDVITVTFNTAVSFCVVSAFGISGYNTGSTFDGAAVTNTADPVSITTTNANDFIYGLFRLSSASVAAGSCCTLINSANFQMNEYDKTTSTGTVSMNIGTPGNANGAIAHAVKSR